ncbi:MAG: class I SAM-dependent methyltransferase [Acidimicrobiia bacterium]|nr:class I SAM-dependent methyltransferase [Acidimicrobiia bacterium]
MSGFGRLQAAMYDPMMRGAERGFLGALRERLLDQAQGETLEIGAGTGLNVPRYRTPTRVVLTEPEAAMAARLRTRAATARVPVEIEEASAEALPFVDASFDTVVSTLVLCSVGHPERALAELRRVLKPGGRYLFIEHGGSDDEGLARWQRRLDPVWRRVAGGCHLSRNVVAMLPAAGFVVSDLETFEPRRTGPIKPFRMGVAA